MSQPRGWLGLIISIQPSPVVSLISQLRDWWTWGFTNINSTIQVVSLMSQPPNFWIWGSY